MATAIGGHQAGVVVGDEDRGPLERPQGFGHGGRQPRKLSKLSMTQEIGPNAPSGVDHTPEVQGGLHRRPRDAALKLAFPSVFCDGVDKRAGSGLHISLDLRGLSDSQPPHL